MKIVFLTSESAHHYFLVNEIHKVYPVQKVYLQKAYQPQQRSWPEKIKNIKNFARLRILIRNKILNLLFRAESLQKKTYEQELFFNGGEPRLDASIPREHAASFNDEKTVQKVAAESPDLVIVFGTDILRGGILNVAKKAILNIHRGIVPQYKGGGLPLWVFYNKDFDRLGVTVHLCTQNLDSGDIVGQGYYKIRKDDKIFTLRGRTTLLTVEVLKRVLEDYARGKVNYVKQGPGKTWTRKDLTLLKELAARDNFNRYLGRL